MRWLPGSLPTLGSILARLHVAPLRILLVAVTTLPLVVRHDLRLAAVIHFLTCPSSFFRLFQNSELFPQPLQPFFVIHNSFVPFITASFEHHPSCVDMHQLLSLPKESARSTALSCGLRNSWLICRTCCSTRVGTVMLVQNTRTLLCTSSNKNSFVAAAMFWPPSGCFFFFMLQGILLCF